MTEPTNPVPKIERTRWVGMTNGWSQAFDLCLNEGHASVSIRGCGVLSLASAKELLHILEDFIGSGDDYEHAEAARAYYEAHPEEVDA